MLSHTTIVISQNDWITTITDIVTAAATSAAVIVTLYLSYRQQTQRLRAHAGMNLILSIGPRASDRVQNGDKQSISLSRKGESSFTLNIVNTSLMHITVKKITLQITSSTKHKPVDYLVFNGQNKMEQFQEESYSLPLSKINQIHIKNLIKDKYSHKKILWIIESTTGKKWIKHYKAKDIRSFLNAIQSIT